MFLQNLFGLDQRVVLVGGASRGIGLAICDRILKNHGGRIWVRPRATGGTVFAFAIPDSRGLAVPR